MAKFEIPKELGTVKELLARYKAAVGRKDPWINHLRECYDYALPQRENFSLHTPGQKKNVDIYDSTAVMGVQKFASRLQATLIPPWRQWTKLVVGSEVKEDQEEVQQYLDEANDVLFDHINHSNFATQAHEALLDLSVSTGALMLEEAEPGGDSLLHFTAVPLADLFPEEGPRGSIETVWRKHSVPARHIDRIWPGADLSDEAQRKAKDKPDAKIELIEGTVFAPKENAYYQCVIEQEHQKVIFTRYYEVSPWIVFREMVVPGEILGRGRVMQVLPAIKTVNKVSEFSLRNAALAISGIYTVTDDGVINPYNINLEPGTAIPVGSNDSSNPTLRPLERAGDFNVSELVMEDLRESINKCLFADPYGGMDSPTKTATEMSMRGQELVMDAGSAFSRLQTEFIEKIIKRSVYILKKNGKVGDFKVDGREVTIKHTSPLARAQDQEDMLAVQQYMEMSMALGPEVFALGTKMEDLPAYIGKKLGIDQELLRSTEERAEIQAQAEEAMQQQQAQAQEMQGGGEQQQLG